VVALKGESNCVGWFSRKPTTTPGAGLPLIVILPDTVASAFFLAGPVWECARWQNAVQQSSRAGMIAKAGRFIVCLSKRERTNPKLSLALGQLPYTFNQSLDLFIAGVACATDAHQTFRLQAETIYHRLRIKIAVRNEQTEVGQTARDFG